MSDWTYSTLIDGDYYPSTGVEIDGAPYMFQNASGGGSANLAGYDYCAMVNNHLSSRPEDRIIRFETRDSDNDRRHTNDDAVGSTKRRNELQQLQYKVIGSARHYFSVVMSYQRSNPSAPGWTNEKLVVFTQIHAGSDGSPPFSIRLRGDGKMIMMTGTDCDDTVYIGAPVDFLDGDEMHVFGYIEFGAAVGAVKFYYARNGAMPTLWVNRQGLAVGRQTDSNEKDWKIGCYAAGGGLPSTLVQWFGRLKRWSTTDWGIADMALSPGQTLPTGYRAWTLDDLPGVVRRYDPNLNATKDSSRQVSSWFSTANTAEYTATSQPIFVPAGCGVGGTGPAMVFDGAGNYLVGPATSLPSGASAGYVFALVEQEAAVTDTATRVAVAHGGGSGGARKIQRAVLSGVNRFRFSDGNTINGPTNTSVDATGDHMVLLHYDGTTIRVDVDGYASSGLAMTLATATNRSRFGANSSLSANEFWDGKVGQVIFGNQALGTDDVDKLFGYFAWTYGMTGLLPATHPYKTEAPTVSVIA